MSTHENVARSQSSISYSVLELLSIVDGYSAEAIWQHTFAAGLDILSP